MLYGYKYSLIVNIKTEDIYEYIAKVGRKGWILQMTT